MDRERIGILTFHWADNYGALLQAFGLKTWLSEHSRDAFIIDYRPARLRGRYWFIQYAPYDPVRMILFALVGLTRNSATGREWFSQKRRMEEFRREYLDIERGAPVPFRGLSGIGVDALIVGSDQIWNPDITFGLLPAYFGAFGDGRPRKVIAYAASSGGRMPERYEAEFGKLLDSVDAVSARESGTAEYIRRRFGREAGTVLDPVFLLDANRWRSMARLPGEGGYILYYAIEPNAEMLEAARELSEKTGLPIVSLAYRRPVPETPFRTVCSAGPLEFLGYALGADYIVANSFHALAFSLIFHKPFLIFNHRANGARTADLMARLELDGNGVSGVGWDGVDRKLDSMRASSEAFLLDALSGIGKGRA